MELAISALFCLHKPFEKAISDLVDVGTRCIELVDAGPHTLNETRVERLLVLKDSYDLNYAIHAPFADINLAADDDIVRKAILKRLETSLITVLLGSLRSDPKSNKHMRLR